MYCTRIRLAISLCPYEILLESFFFFKLHRKNIFIIYRKPPQLQIQPGNTTLFTRGYVKATLSLITVDNMIN